MEIEPARKEELIRRLQGFFLKEFDEALSRLDDLDGEVHMPEARGR